MKIPPVEAELFSEEQTDRRTDMAKLIFAFRNFANVPEIYSKSGLRGENRTYGFAHMNPDG
jgi:hypothetical protein